MASNLSDELKCSKQKPNDSFLPTNNENICNQEMNCHAPIAGGESLMQSTSHQMKPISTDIDHSNGSSSAQNDGLEDDYLYHDDSVQHCVAKSTQDMSMQSQEREFYSSPLHKAFQNDASSSDNRCCNTSVLANEKSAHGIGTGSIYPASSQLPCSSPVYFPVCQVSTSIDQSLEAEKTPVYIPLSPPFEYNNRSSKSSSSETSSTDSNSSRVTDPYPIRSPEHKEQSDLQSFARGISPEYIPPLPSRYAQVGTPSSVRESFIPLSNSQPIYQNSATTSSALCPSSAEEFRNSWQPHHTRYRSLNPCSGNKSVGNSHEYLSMDRYSFEQSDTICQPQKASSASCDLDADNSNDSYDIIELERDVKVPEVITLADDSADEDDGDAAGQLNNFSKEREHYDKLKQNSEKHILWEKQAQHSSAVRTQEKHQKHSDYHSKKRDNRTTAKRAVKQGPSSRTRSSRRKKSSSRHSRVKESNLILESLDAKPPPGSIGELLLKNHTKRFVEKVVSTRPSTSINHTNIIPVLEKPSGDSTGANTEEEEELLLLRKEALQSVVQVLDQRNSQQLSTSPADNSFASFSPESTLSLCIKAAETEYSDMCTSPNKSLIQESQDPIDMEISVSDVDESNKSPDSCELREVGDDINIPIEWAYMIPPPSAHQTNDIRNFEHFSFGQNLCKQAMESTHLKSCSQNTLGSEFPVDLTSGFMDNHPFMQSSDRAKFQETTSAPFVSEDSCFVNPNNVMSFDLQPQTALDNDLQPNENNNLLPPAIDNMPHSGYSNVTSTGNHNLPSTGLNNLALSDFPHDHGQSGPPHPMSKVTQTLSEKNAFNQEAFMDAVTKKKSNGDNLIHIKINNTSQHKTLLNQSKTRGGRKRRKRIMKRFSNSEETLSLVRASNVGSTSQLSSSDPNTNKTSDGNNLMSVDVPQASYQEDDDDDDDDDDDEQMLRNQLLQSMKSKNLDPTSGLSSKLIGHQSTNVQKPRLPNWSSSPNPTAMSANIVAHRLGHVLADGSIKEGNSTKSTTLPTSLGKQPVLTFCYPKPIVINLNDDSDSDSGKDSNPGPSSSNEDSSAFLSTIDSFLKGIREEGSSGTGNVAAGATPMVIQQHLSRPAQMEYRKMKLRLLEIDRVKGRKLALSQSRLEALAEQSTTSDCSTDGSNTNLITETGVYDTQSSSPMDCVGTNLSNEHPKKQAILEECSPCSCESDEADLRQMLLKNRSNRNKGITIPDHNIDDESSQTSVEDLRNFLQRNTYQVEPQIRDLSDAENISSAEPSHDQSFYSQKVKLYLREVRKKSETCENENASHPQQKSDVDNSDTDSDSSISSNDNKTHSMKQSPHRDDATTHQAINSSFNREKLDETPSLKPDCDGQLDDQLSSAASDGLSSDLSSSTDSESDSSHSSDKPNKKSIAEDNNTSESIQKVCAEHMEGEVAQANSNEVIKEDVHYEESSVTKTSTLGVGKDSVVSKPHSEGIPHKITESSEESETCTTPLDNLLTTLKSLIDCGDSTSNNSDCGPVMVNKQSSTVNSDVCTDTSFSSETLLPKEGLDTETTMSMKHASQDISSIIKTASVGLGTNEPMLEKTSSLDTSNALLLLEKNDHTVEKTAENEQMREKSSSLEKSNSSVIAKKGEGKLEVFQSVNSPVQNITLNSSIQVNSASSTSQPVLGCGQDPVSVPLDNSGSTSTPTKKNEEGDRSSKTAMNNVDEKTTDDANTRDLLAMLGKYELLFQGRSINLGSLKQQVRRQLALTSRAELECQKSFAAVERARKQLAAFEAQHKVKTTQQGQSREMLIRLRTQQVADTATLSKLQNKTEHLGRQVKGLDYRIPRSGVNTPTRAASDVSSQACISSRPHKRSSDSPASSAWPKRSNTWVNSSYSVNNSVSWQQNRPASALRRDNSGPVKHDLNKYNKYSKDTNAHNLPKKIASRSILQPVTVFSLPSNVSQSVNTLSATVAQKQETTNVLSRQNQLKPPAAANVSQINKTSQLLPLTESELRDRLLRKHQLSQLSKGDPSIVSMGSVSSNAPKQSTLCPYDLLGTCHDVNCSLEHVSCSIPSSVSSLKLVQGVPTNTCHPKATTPGSSEPVTCVKGSKRSLTERSDATLNKKQKVSEDVIATGKMCVTSAVESGSACDEIGDGASDCQTPVDENDATDSINTKIDELGLATGTKQADSDIDGSSSDSDDSDSSSSDSDSDDSESELTSSGNESSPISPVKSSPDSPVSKTDSTKITLSAVKSVTDIFQAANVDTSWLSDGNRSCPLPVTTSKDNFSPSKRRVASVSDLSDDHNAMSFDRVKANLKACSVQLSDSIESKTNILNDARNTESCTDINARNDDSEQADVASVGSENVEQEIDATEKNQPVLLASENVDQTLCSEQLTNYTSNSTEQAYFGDKPDISAAEDEQQVIRSNKKFDTTSVGIEDHESCTQQTMPAHTALLDGKCIGEHRDDESRCVKASEKSESDTVHNPSGNTEQPEPSSAEQPEQSSAEQPEQSSTEQSSAEQPELSGMEYPDDQTISTEQPENSV